MHSEQRQQARELLEARQVSRALFANPYSVTWLTGFAAPLQLGPGPFAGGPPLVWYQDGEFSLIVLDNAETPGVDVPLLRYAGNTVQTPIRSAGNLQAIVHELFGRKPGGQTGVEGRHAPAFLVPSQASTVEIDGWLDPLRMIKTAEELEKLRRAFALTDLAHAAARHATRAGAREIDVWCAAHTAVEGAAGGRTPFGNDCVVSYREDNIGGWPLDLELRPGDSLMVDLSVRVDGYWSDSCATYYASEPDARQTAMHRTAAEALELAISLVKPGAMADEIDTSLRAFIAGAGYPVYRHHTGHGVGVSPHEEPRIVPYNHVALEAGMVLMLEPGIYFPREAAVRLEDAVLVTATGAEVLTRHDKRIHFPA
jgi:Xaa-Pro dipeptidase